MRPNDDIDGDPKDYFDQGAIEDDAWSEPGVLGIAVAVLLIIFVVAFGFWADANPSFLDFLLVVHR
jgi:hypothetical protein